jgi:hypothetical protein
VGLGPNLAAHALNKGCPRKKRESRLTRAANQSRDLARRNRARSR